MMRSIVLRGRRRQIWWVAGFALMAAYVVVFGWYSGYSLQDHPNHLARAVAMSDLIFHGGALFGASFQYHFSLVPYLLDDLTLAGAVELFGARGASGLWVALVVASFPCAVLFYLRHSG